MELDGKVALVTGAGRGIGRAIAFGLARAGATVAVNDIDAASAQATAAALTDAGHSAAALAADVAEPEAVTGLVAAITDRWTRLDVRESEFRLSENRFFT